VRKSLGCQINTAGGRENNFMTLLGRISRRKNQVFGEEDEKWNLKTKTLVGQKFSSIKSVLVKVNHWQGFSEASLFEIHVGTCPTD
jgi:hypothetical protein